ncbi:MAG: Gldg family protein, partial [Alphaproteobacteria bacterium]|nr:Gldg family protein [Alphaproteobacteria bacterium]
YFDRVRELLEQYVKLANGKLRLQVFNPEPFSDDEDSAVSFGLSGLPINQQGDLGYFGLAGTNSTDDNEVIPFLTPERETFLEYDLTKMVKALATPEKQTVGVMSTLLVNGGYIPNQGQRPRWSVIDQINEFFSIQPVPVDTKEIFEEVGTLMVIHPKRFPLSTLYAIDQFVMKGGRVMVFVDPNAEVDGPGGGMRPNEHSDFERIFKKWGVQLRKDKVAGDLGTARRVNVRQGDRLAVADYVAWLALRPGNFDRKNAVMGDLQVVNVASAGILDPIEGAKTTVTPLMRTGMRSMEIEATKVRLRPDVVGLFREFKPSGQPFTIAASITGKVKSAFSDGPPSPVKGSNDEETKKNQEAFEKAQKDHLTESLSDIHAIVVADVDMLHETLWAERQDMMGKPLLVPFANNADFVVNSLEHLMGGASLAELRGRSISNRPFHLVRKIRQDAERQYRQKEQELKKKLEDVRGKLNRLISREAQAEAQGGEVILKPEEKKAIDNFRREMISIRKELRGVQFDLRKDIDNLDAWLKFINIAAIPLLLGLGTLVFAVGRRLRRRHGVVETG